MGEEPAGLTSRSGNLSPGFRRGTGFLSLHVCVGDRPDSQPSEFRGRRPGGGLRAGHGSKWRPTSSVLPVGSTPLCLWPPRPDPPPPFCPQERKSSSPNYFAAISSSPRRELTHSVPTAQVVPARALRSRRGCQHRKNRQPRIQRRVGRVDGRLPQRGSSVQLPSVGTRQRWPCRSGRGSLPAGSGSPPP